MESVHTLPQAAPWSRYARYGEVRVSTMPRVTAPTAAAPSGVPAKSESPKPQPSSEAICHHGSRPSALRPLASDTKPCSASLRRW